MSKRYNQAGREFVADRFIELNTRSKNNSYSRIVQAISQQTSEKDLEDLKNQIDSMTSDGVISVQEKEGLQREWASLQQTYSSINEQFSSNDELKDNPAYKALQGVYSTLSALMSKILDDMTTDYVGEDAKQLSSLFTSVYSYLTICQSVLNAIDEFTKAYTLSVIGNRDILDGTMLTAGIYREGVEQQNPEFIDGNNYTWSRLDSPDSYTPKKGKSIVVDMADLPVSPCRFSLVWKDSSGENPESLSIILELRWGVIKQYAWSNALTEDELSGMMPSLWTEKKPDQPSDKKYLWRRESSDNGKTWTYFRETGEQGEQGEQGNPGEDGKPGEDGVSVVSMQELYAVGSSAITPPNTDYANWATSQPERPKGQYLWSCTKITYSNGKVEYTAPCVVTGDQGDDGQSPKYYYKYTKTNDPDAWKGGVSVILIHGAMLSIHGAALTLGSSQWYDHVPEGPQYSNDFLWTKIVQPDGRVDIIPPPQQGAPAKDIRIIASQDSYQLTTRGIVKADTSFTFTLERNYVDGDATWTMDPASGTNGEITGSVDSSNPDIFHVTIKKGSTIQSFLISVKCEEYDIIRSLRVNGVDGGEEVPYYFGVYPKEEDAELPTYIKETDTFSKGNSVWPTEVPNEGSILKGDYIIYKTKVFQTASDTEYTIEPIPYYYNGTSWVMVDEDSPNYSEIMGTILGDMVAMPDTPVTVKGVYGFFQQLASYQAFIENLFSRYIRLLSPGAIYAGSYNADGTSSGETKGFHLSSDGVLQAVEAMLMKASVTGSFFCQDEVGRVFYTALASVSKTLTCSPKTRWSFSDFLDAVNLPISVTYNGGTYTAERFSESVRAVSSLTGDTDEVTFTAPYSATYRFSVTIRYDGYVTIKHNNITVYDSQDYADGDGSYTGSTTIYLTKGDTVTMYADALGTGDVSASVASCTATLDRTAVFFTQNGEVEEVFYDDTEYFIANSLSTSGFNSSQNLKYASIDGWYSNVSVSDNNLPVSTGTTIKYNGVTYTITAIVKRTGSFSLLTSDGVYLTFNAPSDTGEFATVGWYNIEGNIPLMNNNRGIYSASIYPISPGSTGLGDQNNRFGTGYINTVRSNYVYGNVNSEGTRSSYKVWGAVAN